MFRSTRFYRNYYYNLISVQFHTHNTYNTFNTLNTTREQWFHSIKRILIMYIKSPRRAFMKYMQKNYINSFLKIKYII